MVESETKQLETRIESVIAYQTGAQIKQKGKIYLNKGEQIITITELPESLDKESMRVKGVGKGKIINIAIEFNSKKEYKTEEHEKLQTKREKLEREVKRKEIEIERLNEQIVKYKSAEDVFYDDFPKAFAVGETEMGRFFDFNEKINEYIVSNTELIESLKEQAKDIRKELRVVLNKESYLGPIEEIHNFYEITLNINAFQEGDFELEVRYTMGNCWWQPFYDVSLSEENFALLTMMANVHNRTGLDWENVEVEISTASLKPISLVKPTPMILKEYSPQAFFGKLVGERGGDTPAPLMKLSSASMGLKDSFEMDDMEKEIEGEIDLREEKPAIEDTYAEVSENIGVQSFKIPNKIDIPSDENPHPVNLTVLKLEAEKKYYWSCEAPENVIIQDKLMNEDLLLLAGNVKIYYLEEFLGETSIPIIAPKERFKLGTRVSYDLKIDKKLIDRSKGKKAIKGKLKNNYEYKITIKNLSDVSEDLIILDRIPHSNSENIKVEIEDIEPEPDKNELGVLKWKLNLKGVKDKVINYKYFVEYKKGIIITPSLP